MSGLAFAGDGPCTGCARPPVGTGRPGRLGRPFILQVILIGPAPNAVRRHANGTPLLVLGPDAVTLQPRSAEPPLLHPVDGTTLPHVQGSTPLPPCLPRPHT